MPTIQENLYHRFITAASRLSSIKPTAVGELSNKFLGTKIESETQFALKLEQDEFLVDTATITALMEISSGEKEFKDFLEKISKHTPLPEKEGINFDKVLGGIFEAPHSGEKNTKKK